MKTVHEWAPEEIAGIVDAVKTGLGVIKDLGMLAIGKMDEGRQLKLQTLERERDFWKEQAETRSADVIRPLQHKLQELDDRLRNEAMEDSLFRENMRTKLEDIRRAQPPFGTKAEPVEL